MESYIPPPWRRNTYINKLEFLCMKYSFSLFHFLVTRWFMSAWVHGYFFCTLVYNPIQLYWFNPIQLYWFLLLILLWVWSLEGFSDVASWYIPLLLVLSSFFLLFLFYSASSLADTIRCSRLMSYISCPSPGINHFSRKPWFLLLNDIRTQDVDVIRESLLLGHLIEDIFVCKLTSI